MLPPARAIVLYNGEEPWTAPLSLAELVQPIEGLTPPSFEYVVLDASHYPPEDMRPVKDVVSGVFLIEQVASLSELEAVLDEIDDLVDDPELEQDIALLISSVIGKLARRGEKVPRLRTLQEVRDMLEERIARWPKQWLQQGRREGRQEGLRQGKADLLKAQVGRLLAVSAEWLAPK